MYFAQLKNVLKNSTKLYLRFFRVEHGVLLVGTQETGVVSHLQRALADGGQARLEQKELAAQVLDHALGGVQRGACIQ